MERMIKGMSASCGLKGERMYFQIWIKAKNILHQLGTKCQSPPPPPPRKLYNTVYQLRSFGVPIKWDLGALDSNNSFIFSTVNSKL